MKEKICEILNISTASYYRWRKNRKIIKMLEKYFSKEDLEEFLNTEKIDRLEQNYCTEIEDFILKTAISKITEALKNKKMDDKYTLAIIEKAIRESKDEYDIEWKILEYLKGNAEKTMKIRNVLSETLSQIEKKVIRKNKTAIKQNFEEYLRKNRRSSSLFPIDLENIIIVDCELDLDPKLFEEIDELEELDKAPKNNKKENK